METKSSPDFLKGKYSREHTWSFDGGAKIAASPSPSVVPAPWSNPACVDPEEAFVASVSSCHMLTFCMSPRARASKSTAEVRMRPSAPMAKNERGVPWVSVVTLHPKIVYGGDKRPSPEEENKLHHLAHEQCFIANSVKTNITVASKIS